MFWQVNKFIYRCFPFDELHNDIDDQLASFQNYFSYFSSAGRNIPIVSVSLMPRRIEDEYLLIYIFNGCVAGLLRGLGLGPLFFVNSVKHYVQEACPWRNSQSLDKVFFINSIQVQKNPYAVQTCVSYLGSGVLTHIFVEQIPRGPRKAKAFLQQLSQNTSKYSLPKIVESFHKTWRVNVGDLVHYSGDLDDSEEDNENREIVMLGLFGEMLNNGYKPVDKPAARAISQEIVKYLSQQ